MPMLTEGQLMAREHDAALSALSTQVATILTELRQLAAEQVRSERAACSRFDALLLAEPHAPLNTGDRTLEAEPPLGSGSSARGRQPRAQRNHPDQEERPVSCGQRHSTMSVEVKLCGVPPGEIVIDGSLQEEKSEIRGDTEKTPGLKDSQRSSGTLTSSPSGSSKKLQFSSTAKKQFGGPEGRTVFGRFEAYVRSPLFDTIFALLIFLNTVVMAVEAQWMGLKKGVEVEYHGYIDPQWQGAAETFEILELLFGFIFCIELIVKIVCFRQSFVRDAWNIMDATIVMAWAVGRIGDDVVQYMHPGLLRLIRLVRLLRLVRLVRSMQGMDSLIIMTTSMRGSASILFWTIIVLTLVLALCALLLQAVSESYLGSDADDIRRWEVFKYYGTFARSLLTMFEITLGNWMPPCRALVENVNEGLMIFFLVHKLVIGFSVLNVISGVFMQETFKVASTDDHIMLVHRLRAIKSHSDKLRRLFRHLDDDGDNTITLDEFMDLSNDFAVKQWLMAMELDVRDVESVFSLLDEDKSGHLSIDELVQGVARIKGGARSIDLCTLLREDREHWKELATDVYALLRSEKVLAANISALANKAETHAHFHVDENESIVAV